MDAQLFYPNHSQYNGQYCFVLGHDPIKHYYQNLLRMVDATVMSIFCSQYFLLKKVSIWLMQESFQPWKSSKAFCKIMVILFTLT